MGSLCLFDTRPRSLSPAEQTILQQMAGWLERELAVQRELERAGEIQQQLMPRTTPDLPGYQLAGRCTPTWQIGGDFYDWHQTDGALQLHVADVMGKGIPAALIAASARAVLRTTFEYDTPLRATARASAVLEDLLEDAGTFVTAFSARVDPATGALHYIDAGHGLAAIFDAAGGHRRLRSSGPPIAALPGTTWEMHTTTLDPGETLLVVSDGFLDFFPDLDTALTKAVDVISSCSSAEQIVERFTDYARTLGHPDDTTVVALHREPR